MLFASHLSSGERGTPSYSRRVPLVLVNGLAEQSESWYCNIEAWRRHFEVHTPQLLAYEGAELHRRIESGKPVDIDYLVQRLHEYLDGFAQSPPYHFVANSLGGKVAVEYAVRYPDQVAKLVLLCPSGLSEEERLPVLEGVRRNDLRSLVESVFQDPRHVDLNLLAYYEKQFAKRRWRSGLLRTIRGLLNVTELPPVSASPLAIGFVTAVALLAGFALPPLLQLSRVPALRVLRRDVGPPPLLIVLAFGPALAVVLLLVYWVVPERQMFLYFTGGLAAFVLVLTLAGGLLVALAGRLRGRVGVAWRFGVANLSRRRAESVVQLVAFGTGIMVLLLLSILRTDLNSDWQRTLPQNLPNYFFVNIPPQVRTEFMSFLQAQGARTTRLLPMIRGRLLAINGQPVEESRGASGVENFATREQNLTWAPELGPDNRIVAGRWWSAADAGQPLVSLATEFQEALGVRLGDRLTFDIAGETREVKVASIRKVKWDTFEPNFFIVFAPGVLEGTAGTYLTSAYFAPGAARSLAQLAHRFPSVSIFDIDELLAQVRSVLDKAALAVQSVFVFTLFAGLTVLLAAVQSSRDERRYESAMLRTLGASRGTVVQGVLAEFATLGTLSGLLAALGASLAAYYLTTHWLELHYVFEVLPWIEGVLGGALLVAAGGWLATRSVIDQPPLSTLRA